MKTRDGYGRLVLQVRSKYKNASNKAYVVVCLVGLSDESECDDYFRLADFPSLQAAEESSANARPEVGPPAGRRLPEHGCDARGHQ